MTVILCVDDRGGMLFNRRRVSSDQEVIRRILERSSGRKLWMNSFSAALFAGEEIRIDGKFLDHACEADFCFVEDLDPSAYCDKIDKWILYRWNRRYPSDFKFDFSLLKGKKLADVSEFKGKSHPRITEETYR